VIQQRVFVDADVLYSACLRNWLFQLRVSTQSMFLLYTSEDVIAETLSKLRDNNPRWDGGQTTRIRAAIIEVFDEIIEDFDGTVEYQGSDPDDFHVHAATLGANADILLTCDIALLNQPNADELRYEAFHPDDFFVLVNDSAPLNVREATMEQLRYYVEKQGERNSRLVDSLVGAQTPRFAEVVRSHLMDLAGALPRHERRKLRRFERLNVEVTDRVSSQVQPLR
jgi:predicted nucleic acid-binding protein